MPEVRATLREAVDRVDELRREAIPRLSARNRERVYNPEWIECLQVENLCTATAMIARGALAREESRGAHFRDDYPNKTDEFSKVNLVIQRDADGQMRISRAPVPEMPSELQQVVEENK